MSANEKELLDRIAKELKSFSSKDRMGLGHKGYRKYFNTLREAFCLFEDVAFQFNKAEKELKGVDSENLHILANEAILNLGGTPEPCLFSLKDYDHHFHGPFLGVSDEGSAAHIIKRAALNSPKIRVIGKSISIYVGVALDAERLAAAGEVAVRPDEYRKIILDCQGSILKSTNVGTRLNLRYYKKRPIIWVPSGPLEQGIDSAINQAKRLVYPFWRTPDGNPRPITLFAFFKRRINFLKRIEILKALREALSKGDFCNPKYHKLGLLATTGYGWNGLKAAIKNIDLAGKVGITEVAIKGMIRWEAEDKISMPGLLNYFSPKHVIDLLQYAAGKKIIITPKNLVDPDTVARNVWSSLQVARNMGFELGKYGLFPLTLEESSEVMGLIQRWFSNWTAAPVLYVDFPIVGRKEVYIKKALVTGAKKWLDLVARHNIPVVLFDTADKDKGRKLLKNYLNDRVGILTLKEVEEIDSYANKKGIKSLWAGGITMPQVLEFGKLEVFGIYVTTSAADIRPVSEKYARDPMIIAEKEITFEGASRVNLLLEAGFMISCLRKSGLNEQADTLETKASTFANQAAKPSNHVKIDHMEDELFSLVENAWRLHYSGTSFLAD